MVAVLLAAVFGSLFAGGVVWLVHRRTRFLREDGPTRGDGGERGEDDPGRTGGPTRVDGGYGRGTGVAYGKPTGVLRWVTTVDHKDIGLLYLAFATVAFLWGGTDALMMRTEMLTPAVTVWDADTYNQLFTMHAITMLFLFATPAIFGVANYFLPMLIGADDLAFPRINAIAFWLLPASLVLVRVGLMTDVVGHAVQPVLGAVAAEPLFRIAPAATGWTFYTPLAIQMENPGLNVVLLGLHLSGLSTTMAAVNFIATVFTERSPDVGWENLDLFSWNVLVQAGLILFAFPLLGAALIMLLSDRVVGTTFFTVGGGGPLLWQHLFWFFGHPEVYILVLPPMGLISLILPQFAGRRLFGYRFVVYSTLAIGVMSFGVWAHHMFATGMDPRLRASFMAVSVAIAVPSAVKTFNWITTMWYGKIRLRAPMLFCTGAVATFIVGGVTGVFLASIPVDLLLHDTYYVVGHFHLIIMGIIPFALFAGLYYWFPIVTGKMYRERLARIHFVFSFVGVWLTFIPMLVVGQLGLPRRYAAYPEQFAALQWSMSAGAALIAFGQLFLIWNVIQSLRREPRVRGPDPWNLEDEAFLTNEWRAFADSFDRRED